MSANDILGRTDAMKVKSCMTLFYIATGDSLFKNILQKFYDGKQCKRTLAMMDKNKIAN